MKLKKSIKYNNFFNKSLKTLYNILLNKNTTFDEIFFNIERKSKSINDINKLYDTILLDDYTYIVLLNRHMYDLIKGNTYIRALEHIKAIQKHKSDKYEFYDCNKNSINLYYNIFCDNYKIKQNPLSFKLLL